METLIQMIVKESCILFGYNYFFASPFHFLHGSENQIRVLLNALTTLQDGKVSFGFGEQDLFITSELNDRLSFLGESVFKYTPSTPTEFSVSMNGW